MKASDVISLLNLVPLPEEGGYYRETFRDEGNIPASVLPSHGGQRCYSTCIYYLITPDQFSGLHGVRSSEVFHFYLGDPVQMVQISSDGHVHKIVLGSDLVHGHALQTVVPRRMAGNKTASRWSMGAIGMYGVTRF